MRFLAVISLVICLALSAEAAHRVKRGDMKGNRALLLTYRPNNEIRTTEKTNNKSWTYNVDTESSEEDVNEKLLAALIKDKMAKRLSQNEIDDRKTVKRESKGESCDSEEIDDLKMVQAGKTSDKKACYKNTYKNVLDAFETALKSQINSYKKCVCQKNKKSTTTTATTTTTTTTAAPRNKFSLARSFNGDTDDDEDLPADGVKLSIGNDKAMESALDHKDNIICFHKQYAFMLNKLLKRIPCSEKNKALAANSVEEFKGEDKTRTERNHKLIGDYPEDDDEEDSFEINVADVEPTTTVKTTTTTTKPPRKTTKFPKKVKIDTPSDDDDESLNQQLMSIIKQHMSPKKEAKPVEKTTPATAKKIVIKQKPIPQPEEIKEENAQPESEEFSQQEFVAKLKELFQKYQNADETFPMPSGERVVESTSSLPARKSARKTVKRTIAERSTDDGDNDDNDDDAESGAFYGRHAVAESSDESTEAAVKLKNRKPASERVQLRQSSRKASASDAASDSDATTKKSHSSSNAAHSKKSYRVASRANDERNNSVETENVSRSVHSKKSHREAKASRASADDRHAADFAKKISDFARGKSSQKL